MAWAFSGFHIPVAGTRFPIVHRETSRRKIGRAQTIPASGLLRFLIFLLD